VDGRLKTKKWGKLEKFSKVKIHVDVQVKVNTTILLN